MDKASLLDWCSVIYAGKVGNFSSVSGLEGGEGPEARGLKDMVGMSRKEQKFNVISLALPRKLNIDVAAMLIQNQPRCLSSM